MLLRLYYSNTKRFLKRSIKSFKSYLPGGYQRLPKTPPCNPFSCTETTNLLKVKKESNLIINHHEAKQENKKINHGCHGKDEEGPSRCLVTRKLKELEMKDRNNVDLVLDIEEVLHYYSRLTCPVYRDIIEKFFVEMYSGTFNVSHVDNLVTKRLF